MTRPPLQTWTPGTSPEAISTALFDGALIVFDGLQPIRRLITQVRAIIEDIFESADPMTAETSLGPTAFRRRALHARHVVESDENAQRYWRDSLAEIGYASEDSYLDRIRLRVVPSWPEAHGRVVRPLPPHRDTWGSGIMAQINWWLPLFPLSATRTMLVWPNAFRRPIANTSADWDYDALMAGQKKDYPLLPVACEPPNEPGIPVLIEPGALLAFSAAHLHASAADESGISRFSIDTRTVWAGDAAAARGAPNVDGAARCAHWEWFDRPPRSTYPGLMR